MKLRRARAVLGTVGMALLTLAGSACGSASPRVPTTASGPRTVALHLPVSRPVFTASGTGSKKIRPFAFHGKISVSLSCTGRGNLDLEIVASPSMPGLGTTCPEIGDSLGPGPGSGPEDGHGRITVDAPARVHWTVTVREFHELTLTAPARVQRLPVHRSGVGSTLLGVFAVRGSFYVKGACLGTGTFAVNFGGSGSSTVCPNSLKKPAVIAGLSGDSRPSRVRIWIRAPAGMKWTLTAAEGPTP